MNDLYQRLTEGHQFLPFDCGDKDLNEFHNHSSVELTKNAWRKIKGSVPHEKHRKDNPKSEGTYAMYFDLSKLLPQ